MPKINVDGVEVELNVRRLEVGSIVSIYGVGSRVIMTMPTFDKCDTSRAKKFAELLGKQSHPWCCAAVSVDHTPILRSWAMDAGWEGHSFGSFSGEDVLGVFSQTLGVLVPAIFIIDFKNRLLYCEFPSSLDGAVDFKAAIEVVANFENEIMSST